MTDSALSDLRNCVNWLISAQFSFIIHHFNKLYGQ